MKSLPASDSRLRLKMWGDVEAFYPDSQPPSLGQVGPAEAARRWTWAPRAAAAVLLFVMLARSKKQQ